MGLKKNVFMWNDSSWSGTGPSGGLL